MNYKEFVEELYSVVKEQIGGGNVEHRTLLKNNGLSYEAFILMGEGDGNTMNPTCYLEDYYDEFLKGRDLYMISSEILSRLHNSLSDITFPMEDFEDFNKMKDRIAFRVVNTEANLRLLATVPHINFLDLSLVFYCILDIFKDGSATTLITRDIQNMWGVTIEELCERATVNTPFLFPCKVRDMDDVIREIFLEEMIHHPMISNRVREDDDDIDLDALADIMLEDFNESESRLHMYVMTNESRLYGAACMFYKGFLKKLADKMECDFIILPSSIHEVILLPKRIGVAPSDYDDLVSEINLKAVDPGEVLSDHIYLYKRREDMITM